MIYAAETTQERAETSRFVRHDLSDRRHGHVYVRPWKPPPLNAITLRGGRPVVLWARARFHARSQAASAPVLKERSLQPARSPGARGVNLPLIRQRDLCSFLCSPLRRWKSDDTPSMGKLVFAIICAYAHICLLLLRLLRLPCLLLLRLLLRGARASPPRPWPDPELAMPGIQHRSMRRNRSMLYVRCPLYIGLPGVAFFSRRLGEEVTHHHASQPARVVKSEGDGDSCCSCSRSATLHCCCRN